MLRAGFEIIMHERLRRLRATEAIYAATAEPAEIRARQLDRLNRNWTRAWREIPFYQQWRAQHGLPEAIGSLAELADFPVLTKTDIQENADLVARTPGATRTTLTGGTSGLSTAFPMNDQDAITAWTNSFVGRGWGGVRPYDRLFIIWGHSHLFGGRGVARKRAIRALKDRMLNVRRVSAYNLDDISLQRIAASLEAFRPAYIIAYGSSLMHLCAHAEAAGLSFAHLETKRVVNTSESIQPEEARRVAALFGCPVVNEYGMSEAGVIGYSADDLFPIRVLWHDYLVQTRERRLLVTTIGDRCFPLFHYDTEDLCPDRHARDQALLSLSGLLGKARDVFRIVDRNGRSQEVSTFLFDHILKQIQALRSLHFELRTDGVVLIKYTASDGAPEPDAIFRKLEQGLRLEGIEVDRNRFAFERIAQPIQTVAGKRRTLQVQPSDQ